MVPCSTKLHDWNAESAVNASDSLHQLIFCCPPPKGPGNRACLRFKTRRGRTMPLSLPRQSCSGESWPRQITKRPDLLVCGQWARLPPMSSNDNKADKGWCRGSTSAHHQHLPRLRQIAQRTTDYSKVPLKKKKKRVPIRFLPELKWGQSSWMWIGLSKSIFLIAGLFPGTKLWTFAGLIFSKLGGATKALFTLAKKNIQTCMRHLRTMRTENI